MSYLALLKEIFGKRGTQVVCICFLVGMLTYYIPRYFVTAPVFAQAMQQMHQQMRTGDRLQEKAWLVSENDRLEDKKMEKYYEHDGELTEMGKQIVRDIDEKIRCNTRRIEQINLELQNQWKGD